MAVTLRFRSPASLLLDVPLNVRVVPFEGEPGREGIPVGQRGIVGQRVARIGISKGRRRDGDAKGLAGRCGLVKKRIRDDRRFIDVLHRERKDIGGCEIAPYPSPSRADRGSPLGHHQVSH